MPVNIHLSRSTKHIALLRIDHPPANCLSKKIKRQINEALDDIEQDAQLRVLIITGSGDKFCTGDDLKEAIQNARVKGGIINNLRAFGQLMNRIEALPFPIIAAINGWCIGGGLELALCCDIRLAVENAQFITSGINVGLMASAYRLPRIIGIGPAKHLLLTGKSINASKALQFGLITEIYSAEKLLSQAMDLARLIANKAPLAVQATKEIANKAYDLNQSDANQLQQETLEELAISQDHQEALAAFAAKRTPSFKGR